MHKPTYPERARTLRVLSPSQLAVEHSRVLKEPLAATDRAIAALARELECQAKKQGLVISA